MGIVRILQCLVLVYLLLFRQRAENCEKLMVAHSATYNTYLRHNNNSDPRIQITLSTARPSRLLTPSRNLATTATPCHPKQTCSKFLTMFTSHWLICCSIWRPHQGVWTALVMMTCNRLSTHTHALPGKRMSAKYSFGNA